MGAELFLTLNTSFTSVCKLRWRLATDLSFIKSLEKVELKLLYTSLSALPCNPLIQLLNTLIYSTKQIGSIQNEAENRYWLKFFEVPGIYGKILVSPWFFVLALLIITFVTYYILLLITFVYGECILCAFSFSVFNAITSNLVLLDSYFF